MLRVIRLVVGIGSVVALGVGAIVLVGGSIQTVPAAIWLLIAGVVGIIGIGFERMRYRSEAAERSGNDAGPAGREADPSDPRFRATDERFVDPTTRERLRVWIDPASGERRYRLDE